jgi:hypothetical protein
MKSKKTRVPAEKSELSSPRRRFRIEKLEERIAPKKGGKGTHNCGGGTQVCTDGSFGSIY